MARHLQVCLSGHVVTSYSPEEKDALQTFCGICGRTALIECPRCGHGILPRVDGPSDRIPPAYCTNCSAPFPWSTSDTLTREQQAALKEYEALREELVSLTSARMRRRQFTWAALGVIFAGAVGSAFFELGVLAIYVAALSWIDSVMVWGTVARIGAYIETKIEPRIPGLAWEKSYTTGARKKGPLRKYLRRTIFGFDHLSALVATIGATFLLFHDALVTPDGQYLPLSELLSDYQLINIENLSEYLMDRTLPEMFWGIAIVVLGCTYAYDLSGYWDRSWWKKVFEAQGQSTTAKEE